MSWYGQLKAASQAIALMTCRNDWAASHPDDDKPAPEIA